MRAQLSFVLSQITRLTDGRTDRQTNSFLVASPRWHSMQRVKKRTLCLFDRLRVGESNGQNADRLDWQPYHAAKWWLAVWLGSALRPHITIFGGRHCVRWALRPWPTADAL